MINCSPKNSLNLKTHRFEFKFRAKVELSLKSPQQNINKHLTFISNEFDNNTMKIDE